MKRTITALALGAVAVGATALAAPAKAVPPDTSVYVAQNCEGLSPNIIDIPYYGGMSVMQERSGSINVRYGNPSVWGYRTVGTLSWKNLNTGKHGSVPFTVDRSLGSNGFGETFASGPGTIRLTTTGVNHGPLLTLAAPRCSGTVHAR
ncbi:hypothetical protein [Gordonia sp. (in: high G+C Gram-positive bacteria)]|uniref:hypothetical protein n=1 Tax=Gordonia sp. (in: high G+C Gram-positive bacteria) TaxID=84139 RepID=UPI003F9E20C7